MLNTPQRKRNRRLKRFALIGLVLYVMIGSALYLFQEKLLFMPTVLPQDYAYEFQHNFEEYFLEAKDGARINTLHFKAENPKGVILYFHGNAGDLQRWGTIAGYFVDLNYDVYIMDYRTYGKSTGVMSQQALYDDAELCYKHLNKFWKKEDIVIYGRSLGGSMATYLASVHQPKQLILETPFYSIADVAKHRFPIFPVKKLLKYPLPNYKHIVKVKSPTTIFHGTNDRVVPLSSAQKLFNVASQKNTQFFTIEGGGHNNLIEFDQYRNEVRKLLKY